MRYMKEENKMKEAEEFECWANQVMEGTWAIPRTPEQQKKLEDLMAQELPVGPDAVNATEQLYDLVGDDVLFDRLQELAFTDPDADARRIIYDRLQELGIDVNVDIDNKYDTEREPVADQDPRDDANEDRSLSVVDVGESKELSNIIRLTRG